MLQIAAGGRIVLMAAEQFANLAQSTVGTAYVPASGSLVLASATSFPANGPYSVTVVDKNTGIPKMIYRVASVAVNTLSGAAEAVPGDVACNVGDFVFGTMLSAGAMTNVVASAGGGATPSLASFTPPVLADFSWVTTQGGAAAVQVLAAIALTAPTSAGDTLRCFGQLIGADTVLVAAIAPSGNLPQNYLLSGVGLLESGTGKIITLHVPNVAAISGGVPLRGNVEVDQWTSSTAFDSAVASAGGSAGLVIGGGQLAWFKITLTGGSLTFYYSTDGHNFIQLYQQATAAFFTVGPDNWFFFSDASNSGGTQSCVTTLYSWVTS